MICDSVNDANKNNKKRKTNSRTFKLKFHIFFIKKIP